MPRTGAGLAVAPCSVSRAPQGLGARTAALARGPSTTSAAPRSATRALAHGAGARIGARCGAQRPATRRETGPTHREKCARHQWRKGEQRWSNAMIKRTNYTKSTEIRTKLVRNSYSIRTNFTSLFALVDEGKLLHQNRSSVTRFRPAFSS